MGSIMYYIHVFQSLFIVRFLLSTLSRPPKSIMCLRLLVYCLNNPFLLCTYTLYLIMTLFPLLFFFFFLMENRPGISLVRT